MQLNWKKQAVLWIYIAVVAFVVRAGFFYQHLNEPLTIPESAASDPYLLQVESGQSVDRLSAELAQAGILDNPFDFRLYARLSGKAGDIKAGEYALEPGMTPLSFLDTLVDANVYYHRLVIVEGWTLARAVANIQSNPNISVTLDGDNGTLRELFGTDHYPEGMVFPDTYNFTRGTTDREILLRARTLMQRKLDQAWSSRAVGLPYDTPYEALVMASIVEKETALASERDMIASVFVNRLRQGMRLQTDPTVIYGLGERYDGNLTRADLRSDTPYNTYTNDGLPPTPIALPGEEAIVASLQPSDSDYLYFVARGDGSHYFSTTLDEHNRAVRQFQLGESQE